jgi:periplasmic protein TonB
MLAYATGRQQIARRGDSPSTLLFIIGAHVTALAVVMSMKMDLPARIWNQNPEVVLVPLDKPPPEPQVEPKPRTAPSQLDQPKVIIPTKPLDSQPIDNRPTDKVEFTELVGPKLPELPPLSQKIIEPVRTGPRLATPTDLLRPPYPQSKLESQQEASLRLKLTIDERGRVLAVEPVGPADPAFLNAARKHLIARWKYQPATVDGRPLASTTVITLRFELEG